MYSVKACTFLLFIACTLMQVSALKVALMPMIGSSHVGVMDIITQHFIKRGHETVTIFPNDPDRIKSIKPSPLALYEVSNPVTREDTQRMYTAKQPFRIFQDIFEIQRRYCDATISNKTLLDSLHDVDVVISDSLYACSVILPEMINKPYILLSFTGTIVGIHTFMGAYAPTSYIPNVALPINTATMTFSQRLLNVIAGNAYANIVLFMSSKIINELRQKHNVSKHLSLFELRRKFSLFLSANDYCIEYPRPVPPYIKLVGPISVKDPVPLPPNFEEIMQNSPNGLILLSFGSELQLDEENLPEMIQGLGQLPYRVIWKTHQSVGNLPDNVKVVKWMPQSDILGHKNTVALITHCGANSMYEAAYHGIPVVGMPAMLEQKGNAVRIATAGFGLRVDFYSFKAKDIVNAVTEVTKNKKYKEAAIKISTILKSRRRQGKDAIVDWTEYVKATDGAHHLKVHGETLYFYELYNLDVLLFVVVCLYVSYRVVLGCMGMLCGSTPKPKSD